MRVLKLMQTYLNQLSRCIKINLNCLHIIDILIFHSILKESAKYPINDFPWYSKFKLHAIKYVFYVILNFFLFYNNFHLTYCAPAVVNGDMATWTTFWAELWQYPRRYASLARVFSAHISTALRGNKSSSK